MQNIWIEISIGLRLWDGVETKVRGKRMNKRARTNLCYVAGREQEPDVWKGKGRIVDLKKKTALNQAVDRLRSMIEARVDCRLIAKLS